MGRALSHFGAEEYLMIREPRFYDRLHVGDIKSLTATDSDGIVLEQTDAESLLGALAEAVQSYRRWELDVFIMMLEPGTFDEASRYLADKTQAPSIPILLLETEPARLDTAR